MSTDPIVHKEPPVQSNPFARALPGHVNAGAVAIESERAIAEAQGKLVIAKRFPRDQAKAYANIMDACKRPGLAEEACYSFPRGGKAVSGPSIRLTEMLAANWGNVDYGLRELSRREGVSEMEAYCWDLETNTMSSQKFTVRHIRDKTGGGVALTDERDIYELTANMGARRLRARILAIIPADLAQAAVDECTKTLAGSNEIPLADRVRNMVSAFNNQGITSALIEKRIGHVIATILPEELADLRKIHVSIRDGISKAGDWFGDGASNPDLEAAEPTQERPAPKERAKRGAAAAKEVVIEKDAAPVEDIQQAMKDREAKNQSQGGDDNALQRPVTKDRDVTPPVPSNPAPAATPEPRAFLKDGEKLEAVIKLESLQPTFMTVEGKRCAGFKGVASGGFNGDVRCAIGGTATGPLNEKGLQTTMTINAPFEVGKPLNAVLHGKKSTAPAGTPLHGLTLVWIESATAVQAEEVA